MNQLVPAPGSVIAGTNPLPRTVLVALLTAVFAFAGSGAEKRASFPTNQGIRQLPGGKPQIVFGIPLASTYSVGSGGDFDSLTNPGGVFDAINNNGLSGNVIFNVVSDLTGETGAVALNQAAEQGAGGYTITIKPGGGPRSISGASSGGTALLKLNGADRVTIDGSSSGGSDRSLTITNSNADGAVVWIASASGTDGATNNTVKNCNVVGSGSTGTLCGILAGSGSSFGSSADAPNSGNTIQNNVITKVQDAVHLDGKTGTFDQNWTITGNTFGSSVPAEKLSKRGLFLADVQNFSITNNDIRGISTPVDSPDTISGISVGGGSRDGSISGNRIADIKQTNPDGWGSNGILLAVSADSANLTVANNFISDVASQGFPDAESTDNGYGIMVNLGGGYRIWFNSVSLATNQALANGKTAAINIASVVNKAGAVDLRNNVLANTQTFGLRYAIYNNSTMGAAVFASIDANDYFAQYVGHQDDLDRTSLGNWQGATGQDANSIAADPLFISAGDLHLNSAASPAANAGFPIAGVTTDIDGSTRSLQRPEIGADELPVSANLAALALSASGLNPVFATGTTAYSATVGSAVASITVTPTVADPNASVQVRINGGSFWPVVSGSPSGSLALNVGTNPVDVRVTAEFGSPVLTYTISVIRGVASPVAGTLLVTASQGTPLVIAQADVLAVCSDPGSLTLTITSAGPTSNQGGIITLGSSTLTYRPPSPQFVSADGFSYTIQNSGGASASGLINVTVGAPPFPPRAVTLSRIGGSFAANYSGVPGLSYAIEYTDDLTVAFQPLINAATQTQLTVTADPGGQFSFSTASAPPRRFYRARALP